MGATKNHIYTEEQIELARLFKAMAHPARIAIVENLLEHEDLNCNDLRTFIQLAQSTISKHIKQLHEVGILAVEVLKSGAYYQPVAFALEQIAGYIQHLSAQVDQQPRDNRNLYCRPLRFIFPYQPRNQT